MLKKSILGKRAGINLQMPGSLLGMEGPVRTLGCRVAEGPTGLWVTALCKP